MIYSVFLHSERGKKKLSNGIAMDFLSFSQNYLFDCVVDEDQNVFLSVRALQYLD